jgi:hypothetical protein
MNTVSIVTLVNDISNDTGIYFNSFEQDNEFVIAKSHFCDFRFGPTYIEIVDSYNMPGPRLRLHLEENLPFRIDYEVDNYYDILVDTINEIHDKCIACEYKDESSLGE